MRMMTRRLGVVLVLLAATPGGAPAAAQGKDPGALAPVTVTANKVTQAAAEVPVSMAVFQTPRFRQDDLPDLDTLVTETPGFAFQPFGQSGLNLPVVRGLSAPLAAYSSAALLVVDGVPVLRPQGFAASLHGVERAEVLRGPQSPLYGRNAEAGVINLHTRKPGDYFQGRLTSTLGSRHQRSLAADLSGPLGVAGLSLGVSADWTRRRGFIDNTVAGGHDDGRNNAGGRWVLRWRPSTASEALLRYSRRRFDEGGPLWGASGSTRAEVASGHDSRNRSRSEVLSLDVSHRFDNGMRLRAISAGNVFDDRVTQDTDFLPADQLHIRRDNRFRTLSQELRLSGGGARADWLVGVYLDRDDNRLTNEQKRGAMLVNARADLDGDTRALFSQWNGSLSQRWTLTLGGRWEDGEVALKPRGETHRRTRWTRFSPKAALRYQWRPTLMAYVSVTDGFRAGGFNPFAAAADYPAYDPEKVRSHEIGLKGRSADQRWRYTLAAYRMGVTDMQVQQMPSPGTVYITNAASAHSSGLEADAEFRLSGDWSLRAGLALNRTEFDRFVDNGDDYRGNTNPFAPRLTGFISAAYYRPLWYARVRLNGASGVYLDAANAYRRPGHALLDAAVGRYFGDLEVVLYGRNLSDREYDAVGYQNGFVDVYSEPREWGLSLTLTL